MRRLNKRKVVYSDSYQIDNFKRGLVVSRFCLFRYRLLRTRNSGDAKNTNNFDILLFLFL